MSRAASALRAAGRCGPLVAVCGLLLAGCQPAIDLEAGRSYRCARDGGAAPCADGWVCGLEGYCHPPDAGAPYACAADTDCTPGWRCGLNGTCHARSDGEAYTCTSSGDCEQGWRCGLSGQCHAPGVAAPLACDVDGDCEGGWRCRPDGVCFDPAADALRPDALAGPLTAVRVSPLLPSAPPTVLAAGAQMVTRPGSGGTAQELAFVSGRSLVQVLEDSFELDPTGVHAIARVTPLSADLQVYDVAVGLTDAYLATDGGILVSAWDAGSLAAVSPAVGRALRLTTGAAHLAVAFTPQQPGFSVVALDGPSTFGPFNLTRADGGLAPLLDLVELPGQWGTPELLLAATPDGLFMAPDAGYTPSLPPDWKPWDLPQLPNARCPGDTPASLSAGYRPLRMFPESNTVAIEAVPHGWAGPDAGVSYALLALWTDSQPVTPCPTPYWNGYGGWTVALGACQACPGGQRLVSLESASARNDFTTASVQVRCEAGPGGPQHAFTLAVDVARPTACVRTPVTDNPLEGEPLRMQQSRNGSFGIPYTYFGYDQGVAAAGAHGQLWRSTRYGGEPLVLDAAPEVVVGTGTRLHVTSRGGPFEFHPQVGLVPTGWDSAVQATGEVEGAPDWWLGSGSGSDAVMAGQVPGSIVEVATLPQASTFGRNSAGALVSLPDGGSVVVTAIGQQLWSAEVHGWTRPGFTPAPLSLRLTPRPGTPIRSLAMRAGTPGADGGVPLVTGYALTLDALYEIDALNGTHWTADEVAGPEGDWLEVWFDGTRGRLGYADGTIYSLPTPVALSGPVPAGPVSDYAQVCGQAFALADGGLYRLEPPADGGALGSWVPEPLDPVLPAAADRGFGGGRLHVAGPELYVFTRYGGVARLISGCTP